MGSPKIFNFWGAQPLQATAQLLPTGKTSMAFSKASRFRRPTLYPTKANSAYILFCVLCLFKPQRNFLCGISQKITRCRNLSERRRDFSTSRFLCQVLLINSNIYFYILVNTNTCIVTIKGVIDADSNRIASI